jgi:hypothetical protein
MKRSDIPSELQAANRLLRGQGKLLREKGRADYPGLRRGRHSESGRAPRRFDSGAFFHPLQVFVQIRHLPGRRLASEYWRAAVEAEQVSFLGFV